MAECIRVYTVLPRADVKNETSTDAHTIDIMRSTQCTESKNVHLPMAELELINI